MSFRGKVKLIDQKASIHHKAITVGNLNIQRDFNLVSDHLRLLETSINQKVQDKFNIYNVCSG